MSISHTRKAKSVYKPEPPGAAPEVGSEEAVVRRGPGPVIEPDAELGQARPEPSPIADRDDDPWSLDPLSPIP